MMPLVVAGVVLAPQAGSAGSPEVAAESFTRGKALLAQGEFEGALKAFAEAAKADRDNTSYRDQYALLRQVTKMRSRIAKEQNAEKWQETAKALRSYYYQNEIYAEALSLDRTLHSKVGNGESAARLAETLLALNMNAEADELLGGLDSKLVTPQARAFHGIALARMGKLDESRSVAEGSSIPDKASPQLLYSLARMRALLGDTSDALSLLTRCFESTPPSQLDTRKTKAKECTDLKALAATPDFGQVLKTQSKVKESSCSGGTSCGKCPSRTACSKSKG
jgi:thioredoxin-like negative regulator of GroEL